MSWFKHRPKVKEPSKTTPYTTSPMAVQYMESTKNKQVQSIEQKRPKKK